MSSGCRTYPQPRESAVYRNRRRPSALPCHDRGTPVASVSVRRECSTGFGHVATALHAIGRAGPSCLAEKLGDERTGRAASQLVRDAHLLDAPAIEHNDAVGDLERLVLIVRDEETRDRRARRADVRNQRRNSLRTRASSAPNGSSSSSTDGSVANARASATRCRWPPDS